MDRGRGCSELYREVGAGEKREGAARCGTDVVWGGNETQAVETESALNFIIISMVPSNYMIYSK